MYYTYTHIPIYIHAFIHTCMHAYIHILSHMYKRIHTYVHAFIHTYIHYLCPTQQRLFASVGNAATYSCVYTDIYVYTICINAYPHTYIHTYITFVQLHNVYLDLWEMQQHIAWKHARPQTQNEYTLGLWCVG
jgi:hypothetical protein